MYLLSDSAFSQHPAEQCPETPSDRTCRRFAQNLVVQEGLHMTQARLERMCRIAEMKLDNLLQAYSVKAT